MTRIDALLREARLRIDAVDAELLLCHLLGKPRSWLFAHADDGLDADTAAGFAALLERRAAGEPVASPDRTVGRASGGRVSTCSGVTVMTSRKK